MRGCPRAETYAGIDIAYSDQVYEAKTQIRNGCVRLKTIYSIYRFNIV
jgi:hypothetical protein